MAKARAAVEPLLLAAVSAQADHLPDETPGGSEPHAATKTRAQRKRTKSASPGASGGARDEIRQKLLSAPVEQFPDIGPKPPALYAAYALLSWAHKKLGIDGLSPQEIQVFMKEKWRLPQSYQAYTGAMKPRQRMGEVHVEGDRPRIFRLMNPGETALQVWLAEQAKKPS